MGVIFVKLKIINLANPKKFVYQEFLVDSGAIYSVVPEKTLKKIGIKSHSKMEFTLADGSKVKREVGDALFEYQERKGASPVIFGKEKDSPLLGVVTLEALGLMLDPFSRDLRPLPLILKTKLTKD